MESLVRDLKGKPQALGGTESFPSREEWAKAISAWAESHPKRGTLADDSRESIYADQGE